MARKTDNQDRLLATVHDLRVADLELLRALLVKEGFGFHAVRFAADTLFQRGLLHRLWKHRDPKFRMGRGSARQVFLLAEKGAERIGVPATPIERWFTYLKDPRKEYVLDHELLIARFHASLLKVGKLEHWQQGLGTEIHNRDVRLRPDAYFTFAGRHYFLEADTGNERIKSDDPSRRTIEKKIRRYGLIDRDGIAQEQFDIPGFTVVFLTPQRSTPSQPSGRELNILDAIQSFGQLKNHAKGFYRIVSETEVMESLGSGKPLSILEAPVTVEGSGSDSLPGPKLGVLQARDVL